MPRLTLRTLLAYIDDTLEPEQARTLGQKVAESEEAKVLIERIKRVTRRRGLRTPVPDGSEDDVSDPNIVAAYLSDNLDSEQLRQIESTCLDSDVHLAEVAACHQILTLLLTEPVRVPPTANQRMYRLVPAPASDPNRKPGKTIPVGRARPPAEQVDADDPDAALLLGMRRYSAAESWSGRLKLLAAVAAIGLFLVIAVAMALPRSTVEPPESSRGVSYALAPPGPTIVSPPATPPAVTPTVATPDKSTPVVAPDPKAVPVTPTPDKEPKKEPTKSDTPKTDPKKDPTPVLVGKGIPDPIPGRVVVGKMEGLKVIVLALADEAEPRWKRLLPTDQVFSTDVVMALPGYKAEVKLATDVTVRLWGNVPEQISRSKTRVMQSRVRFHSNPAGYGADFTLEEGRVYVNTTKPAGAKVRVRIATECWEIELPNNTSEVLIQSHSAFVPGTPFPADGVGGELPRTDALLVVTRGSAKFKSLGRFVEQNLTLEQELDWDSKTASLSAPVAVSRDEVAPDWNPTLPPDLGRDIQHILSDTADKLTDPPGIRTVLEERINYNRQPNTDLARRIATYSYAALIDGLRDTEAKKMIANLFDASLNDPERAVVRQAGVMTLSAWLARSPSNTSILLGVLKEKNIDEATLICQLLRGYSAADQGPTAWSTGKLDELLKLLNSPSLIVREATLGNLIAYYDFPAAVARRVSGEPPIIDVAAKPEFEKEYEKFVNAWQGRAELIKKWMEDKVKEKMGKK